MSRRFKILIPVILFLLFLPFIFDMIAVHKLSWKEVQDHGGIKVEKPLETQDGYYMPIVCDVAGQDSVTIKPISPSSFYAFKRTIVKIKDHFIYISVHRTGAGYGDGTHCKAAKLGKLESGHYLVYYETGEAIGEFTI